MEGQQICRHKSAESADAAYSTGNNGASFTTVIPNGQTTSGVINIKRWGQGGFITPTVLTGVSFSYLVSDRLNGTFTALAGVTTTVTTSSAYAFPAAVMAFNYVQIVSGSSEGAARTITLSFKH